MKLVNALIAILGAMNDPNEERIKFNLSLISENKIRFKDGDKIYQALFINNECHAVEIVLSDTKFESNGKTKEILTEINTILILRNLPDS